MTGNVIFLTRQSIDKGFNYHYILGKIIAKFTRDKGQSLDDTYVHTAIMYKRNDGELMVRDMASKGDEHIPFVEYHDLYRDRITVVNPKFKLSEFKSSEFNESCANLHVTYDYKNLLIYQLMKSVWDKVKYKKTFYQRICSEDVARQLNILIGDKLKNPESITPNELYKLIN